ncbi:MAG TPA: glycosyltransferase [Tepidisphaeraceae bacterium]|nr:glycosyltransferase [Tepidisphaeraceae bacterium]
MVKLRVAHIVLSLDVGGLERVIIELAREGGRLGQDVSVICLERRGVLADEVEMAGGRVFSLDKPPGVKPAMVGKIRTLLAELRPEVIHTHQIGALLYAGPAARRAGVPVVVHTEHINNIAKPLTRARRVRSRVLWWLAARYAVRFICVSSDIAQAATTLVPASKVRVVANGIDTSAFENCGPRALIRKQFGIPPAAIVVGTIGRLHEVKRQDLLIRAFSQVSRQFDAAHLLLVGDGPEREALKSLVRELGLSDCVHFAGYQSQPQSFLQAMDLFALSSRLEGMPLVVLEAWAAHLPVIASRVGGIPKVVCDGENGILFDSGDQQGLVAALLRLLTDKGEAERISRAGLMRVRSEFDSRHMATNYQAQYIEALHEAGRR